MSDVNEIVPKVERDGKVAVIVSPGFGAGWSTWADDASSAAFAPDVVAWIEAGRPTDGDEFSERYGYTGGLGEAEIVWIPKGSRFMIEEYDGSEGLVMIGPDFGYVA